MNFYNLKRSSYCTLFHKFLNTSLSNHLSMCYCNPLNTTRSYMNMSHCGEQSLSRMKYMRQYMRCDSYQCSHSDNEEGCLNQKLLVKYTVTAHDLFASLLLSDL